MISLYSGSEWCFTGLQNEAFGKEALLSFDYWGLQRNFESRAQKCWVERAVQVTE